MYVCVCVYQVFLCAHMCTSTGEHTHIKSVISFSYVRPSKLTVPRPRWRTCGKTTRPTKCTRFLPRSSRQKRSCPSRQVPCRCAHKHTEAMKCGYMVVQHLGNGYVCVDTHTFRDMHTCNHVWVLVLGKEALSWSISRGVLVGASRRHLHNTCRLIDGCPKDTKMRAT
jgi:hypothetical protein